MKQSSSEADSRSDGQDFLYILLNPKVHYSSVNRRPQLDPTVNQMNPVHSLTLSFPKVHFNPINLSGNYMYHMLQLSLQGGHMVYV